MSSGQPGATQQDPQPQRKKVFLGPTNILIYHSTRVEMLASPFHLCSRDD
jgi:hypothetical protein